MKMTSEDFIEIQSFEDFLSWWTSLNPHDPISWDEAMSVFFNLEHYQY